MAYRSELEARVAKKTTKAIVDYDMLENGDRVIVSGVQKARAGAPVKPVPWQPDAASAQAPANAASH